MPDLTLALTAAAEAATAERAPVAAAPVLARIRRRRTARYAARGTVGVAAAGALAVAGVQAANRSTEREEVAPAATADVTCGLALGTLEPASEQALRFGVWPDTEDAPGGPARPTPANRPVPIHAHVAAPQRTDGLGARMTYALVLHDEVVALPTQDWTDGAALSPGAGWDGTTLNRFDDVPFAACTPEGRLGGHPAPGTYGLVAVLLPDDASDRPDPLLSDRGLVHLGEPVGADQVPPDLEALVLTSDGLGEGGADGATALRLGEPVAAEDPRALVAHEPDSCVVALPDGVERTAGAWVSVHRPAPTMWGTRWEPFAAHADSGGVVRRIDVVAAGLRTDAGVGVGDSLDDVRAAYPDVTLLGTTARAGGMPPLELWGVTVGGRVLAFQVYDGAPLPAEWAPVEPGAVVGLVLQEGTAGLATRWIC